MRENVLPILESYGVDLVFSGHSHSYERSYQLHGHYGQSSTLDSTMIVDGGDGRANGDGEYIKDTIGAVYVVAGSSGKVSAGSLDHPVMYLSLPQLGSVVLDVDGNRLDAAFLSDTGVIEDYLTMLKGNLAPSVDAGLDLGVILPADGALNGTVSDDGQPEPPLLTSTWSVLSGPGTVTFGNASAVDTAVSFSTAGTYVLRLTSEDGELTSSDEITVTVYPAGTLNQPPSVTAGAGQTITLPDIAALEATVTDDGLPNPPGTVITTWSKLSGPGTVTFGNTSTVDTTASFSTAGTYTLGVTADDSQSAASNDVVIAVNAAPAASEALDIRVAAGSDDAEESASGRLKLTSSDLELVQESSNQTVGMRFNGVTIPPGATITLATVQFQADETHSGGTSLTIEGQAANNPPTFSSSANITSRARTSASVAWSPPPWDNKGEQGPDQQTPDIATVIPEIVDQPGWASGNSLVIIVTGAGKRVAESYDGDQNGAPLLHVEYYTGPPANTAPTVASGPDQSVTLPDGATLNGTVTDDGLPDPAALTTTWLMMSGPGPNTVTFGNAAAVDTTASFSTAGTYVLRLTADDTQYSAYDEVTITVLPQPVNRAPSVAVGPDQTITLPAMATLDATVTDDGLPNPPGTVITTWSTVSGPPSGTVTFGNTSAVDTTASFSTAGTYVLRLSADDDGSEPPATSDDVTITVNPEPPNQAPTVSISAVQPVTLPAAASLDGTVTDDGLPSPPALTSTWAKVSGPGTVIFADASAVDTTASFSSTGSYRLRLTAHDGDLPSSADATVEVLPATDVTIEIRVSASADDAEERTSGSVKLTSSDLELVYDKSDQTVGLRFTGVEIPNGATILEAYIQFQVDETPSGTTFLAIQAQAADSPATFSGSSGNVSSRATTTAQVSWSPPPWPTKGVAGPDQRTPNIASVIQEVVNRNGWASGNSLVIIITGTGERVAESYDGVPSAAALLHVEYAY